MVFFNRGKDKKEMIWKNMGYDFRTKDFKKRRYLKKIFAI